MENTNTIGMTADEMRAAFAEKLLAAREAGECETDAAMIESMASATFDVVALNNQKIAEHLAAIEADPKAIAAQVREQIDKDLSRGLGR